MKPCCATPTNIRRIKTRTTRKWDIRSWKFWTWTYKDYDHWHDRCKVCGLNHYGMEVEPVVLGVLGKSAG